VLPTWLTADGLAERIDRENVDPELLESFLEAAFEQAQAPPPFGCGRLLLPDPPLEGDPLADDADPIERELEVTGRVVLVPDAREIVQVRGYNDAVLTAGIDYGNYKVVTRNGVIVALRLATGMRGGYRGGYRGRYGDWRCDPTWPVTVIVKGRFGFLEPPVNLAEAIYTLAGRMYFERDAQYSDQVRVAEGATGEAYFRQLPVRTKLAFASLTVPAAVAGLQ
jgi:hypothetical protein